MSGRNSVTITPWLEKCFERFPSLRFYFAELNACYLPAMLFYLDRNYHEFNDWFDVELKKEPSEYVLEHTLFGMIGDAPIMQMGHMFPLDQLVWGSDFPHSVGTYPNSRDYIAKTFGAIDDDLRRKILVENICDHLGLDPNATITETPAA